jgi:hypothetical protein
MQRVDVKVVAPGVVEGEFCRITSASLAGIPAHEWPKEDEPMSKIARHALIMLGCSCVLAAVLSSCAHAAPSAISSSRQPFSESTLPYYLVRQTDAPITIDGRPDEFAWAAAPQIDGLTRILNDYGRVQQATRAKILWDEEALYSAFACRDTDMWALYIEEDDPMWSEEVVEAFIDPDGDDSENRTRLEEELALIQEEATPLSEHNRTETEFTDPERFGIIEFAP